MSFSHIFGLGGAGMSVTAPGFTRDLPEALVTTPVAATTPATTTAPAAVTPAATTAPDVPAPVEDVVEVTFNAIQLLLGTAIGVVIAIVIGTVIVTVSRAFGRRYPVYQQAHKKMIRPFGFLALTLGAWIGFSQAKANVDPTVAPKWLDTLSHVFLVAVIVLSGWLLVRISQGIFQAIYDTVKEVSAERAARIKTQTQIIQRMTSVVIWILAAAAVMLTFPAARTTGASIFASAGLISVIAGLAAQSTLGNVFAGLQLAFSDSIRVGDTVFYEQKVSKIEEITLTYVVLEVWDGSRIIVPSTKLTQEPFENWTRRETEMTGTVEWTVDWAIPIKDARRQFNYLLGKTDLWDGEKGELQVWEAINGTILLRAVVSAKDSGTLIQLRNHLREEMVEWIQKEAPQAIPRYRRIMCEPTSIAEENALTAALVDARLEALPPAFEPAAKVEEQALPDEDTAERTTVIAPGELEEIARTPISERDPNVTIAMDPISGSQVKIDMDKLAGYGTTPDGGATQDGPVTKDGTVAQDSPAASSGSTGGDTPRSSRIRRRNNPVRPSAPSSASGQEPAKIIPPKGKK
ncbi:MAG: mechanosensitive ion channel family protein [Arcanobacterium sp.]